MCWDTGTPLSTYVRGLEGTWPRSAWGSWWALLLRSQLFGQNVRTPQEAIQPVRHFQGGQDCRCCVVKGMMFGYTYLRVPFPISNGLICLLLYLCPQLAGAERGNRQKSSCPSAWRWLWVRSNHFMPSYLRNQIISSGMQSDTLSESSLWPSSLSSAIKWYPPVLKRSALAGGFSV